MALEGDREGEHTGQCNIFPLLQCHCFHILQSQSWLDDFSSGGFIPQSELGGRRSVYDIYVYIHANTSLALTLVEVRFFITITILT